MTEIVTISASTAAYATEPLKPSNRISGAGQTHDTTYAQVLEARTADNLKHQEMMNVVGQTAIAAFFLSAGERGKRLQQATMREVAEAYFLHVDETERRSDGSSGEDVEDEADEAFHEPQNTILALPAPERYS